MNFEYKTLRNAESSSFQVLVKQNILFYKWYPIWREKNVHNSRKSFKIHDFLQDTSLEMLKIDHNR